MKRRLYLKVLALVVAGMAVAGCGTGRSIEKRLADMPQRAMLITEVHDRGINLDSLESIYPSGLTRFGDSIPQGYLSAWRDFVMGMAQAMRSAGMDWDEPYRLSGRAYFSPDGRVDHYFYGWTGDRQPAEEWKTQFRGVLERYLASYRFAYPMEGRFAQCGGIHLTPASRP